MSHPKITALTKSVKAVFKECYFEYAREGDLEKGTKLTGNKVNPIISDSVKRVKLKK